MKRSRCPVCATRAAVIDGKLEPHNKVRIYYGADAQPVVPCPNRDLAPWQVTAKPAAVNTKE